MYFRNDIATSRNANFDHNQRLCPLPNLKKIQTKQKPKLKTQNPKIKTTYIGVFKCGMEMDTHYFIVLGGLPLIVTTLLCLLDLLYFLL